MEDVFDQDDWENWAKITAKMGGKCQIVGDDLTVTNIEKARERSLAHAERSLSDRDETSRRSSAPRARRRATACCSR